MVGTSNLCLSYSFKELSTSDLHIFQFYNNSNLILGYSFRVLLVGICLLHIGNYVPLICVYSVLMFARGVRCLWTVNVP
jgi:hypothetical protein